MRRLGWPRGGLGVGGRGRRVCRWERRGGGGRIPVEGGEGGVSGVREGGWVRGGNG